MSNYKDLNGKVASITGASGGIGQATAIALAESGASVSINYKRNEAGANDACKKITDGGGRAITAQADVSNAAGVKTLVQRTVEELGPVDVLVNNAGSLIERLRILELSEARWDEVMDLN